jgi:hypothetical protein
MGKIENKVEEQKVENVAELAQKELEALRAKYGDNVFHSVVKTVAGIGRKGSGVAESFRAKCGSIKKLEDKGYNFYVMSSNFIELCVKEGITVSEEEKKAFEKLQSDLQVVGRFWKSKKS